VRQARQASDTHEPEGRAQAKLGGADPRESAGEAGLVEAWDASSSYRMSRRSASGSRMQIELRYRRMKPRISKLRKALLTV
jgi:hypothetical protein